MYGQNIEVAQQVIVQLSALTQRDMPLRSLKVLFHLAQHGPQTIRTIAKEMGEPQLTILQDLQALRKPGSKSKVRHNLIRELPPVGKGKPCSYQLSERAGEIMDDLDFRMQVFALPEDNATPECWTSTGAYGDDDDDETLMQWEATRSVVRG